MTMPTRLIGILLLLLSPQASALSNAFTYQGSLSDAGTPANGSFDLQFQLQTSAGANVGAPLLRNDVVVTGGVFSVELDFAAAITSADFQLQIGVRPGAATGSYTQLSPATAIRPAPQAQIAGFAAEALTVSPGAIGTAQINSAQVQRRIASGCAAGNSIRVVNADGTVSCEASIPGPTGAQGPAGPTGPTGMTGPAGPPGPAGSADAWGRGGNAGTNEASNFLGTTDDRDLTVKVNGRRALWIDSTGVNPPNLIAGSETNSASAGYYGRTIAGGGSGAFNCGLLQNLPCRNNVFYSYATVSGGLGNAAVGEKSTVSGGDSNTAIGTGSVVTGGSSNAATADYATAGGGFGVCAGGKGSWTGGFFARVRTASQSVVNCASSSGDDDGDEGSFVCAEYCVGDFETTGPNQFLVRALGGMAINTNTPAAGTSLTVAGNTSISGNVSFGLAPKQMLNLYDNTFGIGIQTARMYFRVANTGGYNWFMGGTHSTAVDDAGGGSTLMRLTSAGQLLTTTGTISSFSDARLKSDVSNYSGALDQIAALRPVHYRYTDAGKAPFQPEGTHLGFIAQEVQQVFPEWVSQDESGYLMLSMRGFEAVAVRGMQELQAENVALRAETSELRSTTAQLRERLEAIEAKLAVPR